MRHPKSNQHFKEPDMSDVRYHLHIPHSRGAIIDCIRKRDYLQYILYVGVDHRGLRIKF